MENKYERTNEDTHERQCVECLDEEWAADQQRGLPQAPVRLVVGLRTPDEVGSEGDTNAAIEATSKFGYALFQRNSDGGVERFPTTAGLRAASKILLRSCFVRAALL